MLGTILLLNLLIAHLSNVYSDVQASAKAEFRLARVRMVLEAESMLSLDERSKHVLRHLQFSGRTLPASVVEVMREEELAEQEDLRQNQLETMERSVRENSRKLNDLADAISQTAAQLKQLTNTSPTTQTTAFSLNSRVEGNWKGRNTWYRGVIAAVADDGTYNIQYDDGDFEEGVPSDRIRLQYDEVAA